MGVRKVDSLQGSARNVEALDYLRNYQLFKQESTHYRHFARLLYNLQSSVSENIASRLLHAQSVLTTGRYTRSCLLQLQQRGSRVFLIFPGTNTVISRYV